MTRELRRSADIHASMTLFGTLRRHCWIAFATFAACSGPAPNDGNRQASPAKAVAPEAQEPALAPAEAPQNIMRAQDEPLTPPQPGTPGGLPDDRTPVSEAPFAPNSAQGAANIVQTYYALIGEKKYAAAWRLWSGEGEANGMSVSDFAASFDKYREYHANVGAPGEIEGAAGSSYVEVPVQVYGRLKDGPPFNMAGPIALRHVNDVPGASTEQRKWHIYSSGVKPTP
jgi:hypothetical protein